MSTNVLMPQMGESVAEGTIVRWLKQVGDVIDKDEPLFEISTDKVDAEIPAPEAGTLLAIHVNEGETVPINSVVAVIGATTEVTGAPGTSGAPGAPGASGAPGALGAPGDWNELTQISSLGSPDATAMRGTSGARNGVTQSAVLTNEDASAEGGRLRGPGAPGAPGAPGTPGAPSAPSAPSAPGAPGVPGAPGSRLRSHSSPVVRKIAAAHGVDISALVGTGISNRVTRRDIEAFIRRQARAQTSASAPAAVRPALPLPPAYTAGDSVRIEKMSIMRRKIAEHMLASVQTSPHVYSAIEVDCLRVDELRKSHKAAYEAAGTKLTYTAFIAHATIQTIREFPFMNASVDGDNVIYKTDINLGIAVALEQGLIVPVIRQADRLTMKELCGAVQDIANRARAKQLKVEEVQGGTFTITNPGVFGGLWGLPIINQPQVAILAVGSVDKRAVVVDDEVVARPMCYFTLGHDHRLIDGAEGGRFLQALKARIQNFDEAQL